MLTYNDIRHNDDVNALIEAGNNALGVLGFTDHGYAHAGLTSKTAGDLLETLGYDERTCELARIAGYMHDIGNGHQPQQPCDVRRRLLAFDILKGLQMDVREAAAVMTAIGNHDEGTAAPVTPPERGAHPGGQKRRAPFPRAQQGAGLRYPRPGELRGGGFLPFGDEGRKNHLPVHRIDTSICAVMDYFEIFLNRMTLCRSAAAFLGMDFELIINETRML